MTTPPAGTRRLYLFATLVAVGILAWALWSTGDPAPHAGGDNAGYVALADALLDGDGYVEPWDPARPPHTKYPPVFAATLAVAMALGASTWAGLKWVPLLFAIAALAGTWWWVARRRDPFWAAAVTLLTGCSAAFVYHARLLLSDVPFLAFTVGVLALMEGARRRGTGVDGSPGPDGSTEVRTSVDGESPASAAEGLTRPGIVAVAGAVVLAGLAVLTRSAGAPLAVALLGVLAWQRRWKLAAASGVALAVPTLAWWLRGRGIEAEGAYLREFWMVNPYRPELGEIGWTGLIPRAVENAFGYVGTHLPTALAGPSSLGSILGFAFVALAVVGWIRAVRSAPGVAEAFVPMYLALILVWPAVWSGDRFVLPLLPVLLLYAGEGVAAAAARLREAAIAPALAAATAVLLLAQGSSVLSASDRAAACRGAVRAGGPWACAGQGMVQFTEAARWAGVNLPEGSVVLTRKPRIWYAMSGVPTRTYPFVSDVEVLLEDAREAGASYVVLDRVGAQAQLLAAAIGSRLSAFCSVASFGSGDGPRTELLGILPEAERLPLPAAGRVAIGACPDGMRGGSTTLEPYSSSSPIPIRSSSSLP